MKKLNHGKKWTERWQKLNNDIWPPELDIFEFRGKGRRLYHFKYPSNEPQVSIDDAWEKS